MLTRTIEGVKITLVPGLTYKAEKSRAGHVNIYKQYFSKNSPQHVMLINFDSNIKGGYFVDRFNGEKGYRVWE